jgi:hypothetical protein
VKDVALAAPSPSEDVVSATPSGIPRPTASPWPVDKSDTIHETAPTTRKEEEEEPPYTEEELAEHAKYDDECRPAGDLGPATSLEWRKHWKKTGIVRHNVQFPTVVDPRADDTIPYLLLNGRERRARQYRVNKREREEAERKGVPYVPREWDPPDPDFWHPWEGELSWD